MSVISASTDLATLPPAANISNSPANVQAPEPSDLGIECPSQVPDITRGCSRDVLNGRLVYRLIDLHRRGITLSNSTLLRLEAAGQFPKRIYLGRHSVAWLATEIHAHIEALAASRAGAA